MRSVWGRAGFCLVCAAISPAQAAEGSSAPWWSLPKLPLPAGRNYLLFASLDSGPGQRFAAGGVKWALGGDLDSSGFRAIVRVGGAERVKNGRLPIPADAKGETYALIGADQLTGRGAIGIYIGHETASEWTGQARRTGLPPALRSGLRLQADLWDHPAPDMLAHASASASTATQQFWGRLALGYRAFGRAFIGPEIEGSITPTYRKWRYGVHISGLAFLGLDWRASIGQERASDRGRGLYATLSVYWRS